MKQLRVFDPPMCCSSGVCGPTVEPWIAQFAADLAWLQGQGIDVLRYNLTHQPQEFASNDLVRQQLTDHGAGCLPLLIVDGRVVGAGIYPTRDQLASLVGLPPSPGSERLSARSCCSGPGPSTGDVKPRGSGCC